MQTELNDLIQKFPQTWESVKTEILPSIREQNVKQLKAHETEARATLESWENRIRKSHNNPQMIAKAQMPVVENQMKILCIQNYYEKMLRSGIEGKKPLSSKNRWLSNRLFFETGLERKAVSLPSFKILWPFVSQKSRLLSLLNEVGIYGFYSSKFINELARLIGKRSTLEIAAGDGTLAKLLSAKGLPTLATDDYSWSNRIQIPDFVEKLDAVKALKKYQPQVVICSWPPPDNGFEEEIFRTESVELYILVASKHRYAAGNWSTYEGQKDFSMAHDQKLSSLVIPKESDSAVYLFTRLTQTQPN